MDSNNSGNELIASEITSKIIGAVYEVHTVLGPGFLEGVYQKALVKELRLRGLEVEEQKDLRVTYKGEEVGLYFPDIFLNSK
jgi:GxxExxY protein